MCAQLQLQVRVLLSLRLHYSLDDLLIFINNDTLDHLVVVEGDSAGLHADRFLQVFGPGVVDTNTGFLAALDRVSLGELGALLDDVLGDLAVVVDGRRQAQVDVSGGEVIDVEPNVAIRPRIL
eukprot:CAMPEP_0185612732 /NCGR_PEP_ID=MMETSP0436-20130131/23246_1 /TAXON_ID=626734 ORGANISM="Favella taraikaensis, Strain Fe Narragansett Bay" /NCGR_SAMPLE_ID=MMETSP0436 /ASSEMBLY_ACC=CAM_ASM_000390 /LENGTH=122 /DNA_ID=CAMNT_0028246343 /DNA_START=199 /DNA_END=563 /DNA_ORIENTATION=+